MTPVVVIAKINRHNAGPANNRLPRPQGELADSHTPQRTMMLLAARGRGVSNAACLVPGTTHPHTHTATRTKDTRAAPPLFLGVKLEEELEVFDALLPAVYRLGLRRWHST